MTEILKPNKKQKFIGHPTIRKNHRCDNKVIDDFIKKKLFNRNIRHGEMEFVPYNKFSGVEFIAEGGFSKVYKATWINGPIYRNGRMAVALKELNNSKDINSKELNEVQYSVMN